MCGELVTPTPVQSLRNTNDSRRTDWRKNFCRKNDSRYLRQDFSLVHLCFGNRERRGFSHYCRHSFAISRAELDDRRSGPVCPQRHGYLQSRRKTQAGGIFTEDRRDFFPANDFVFDPQGRDIVGRGVPEGAEQVREARATGETQFHIRLLWTGASVVDGPDGRYILVAKVLVPYSGLLSGAIQVTAMEWLIPAVPGALLCLLLARHIASPIRTLQSVAGKIADGDLSVRAFPAMSSRKDEVADLARDFDRMADRIQTSLRKQHELLGDISHELRSPLTCLNVSLELVRRGETDGPGDAS